MTVPRCTSYVWKGVTRRKTLSEDAMATPLKRCLKWWHLALYGVGQMAGAGVYVLTGVAAKTHSGPATFIAYIIAGVCAIFCALCYAEFGARCPKAGSAYTYTYVSIGELLGFCVGWNLLLEHSIGASSTARAWSGALNSLTNGAIQNWTITHVGYVNLFGSEYTPDFVSVALIFILTCLVLYGVEMSMYVTAVFSVINATCTILIVILGLTLADGENWREPDGFAPHGMSGIISAAAMLFYAFVGFDAIAMAGEEAEKPSRDLPIANMLSIGTVLLMYVGMSIALTLAVPYDMIDANAAFPEMFGRAGRPSIKIMVNVVMLLVIQSSTICALFAAPRCAYSMASDGVLFRFLAYVHPWTKTPVVAIVIISIISSICAVLLNVETLAEFVSLGTLMAAYTVSASVIIIRYQPEFYDLERQPLKSDKNVHRQVEQKYDSTGRLKVKFQKISFLDTLKPGIAVKYTVFALALFIIVALAFGLIPDEHNGWTLTGMVFGVVMVVVCFVIIILHEQNDRSATFQVPLSPLTPTLSMVVVGALLVRLSSLAWIRFVVWMAIGLVIYFLYGLHHSAERPGNKETYMSLPENSPTTSVSDNDLNENENENESEK